MINAFIHLRCIVSNCLGTECRRHEFVHNPPSISIGVTQEYACEVVLEWKERMVLVDEFGEELCFVEADGCNVRVTVLCQLMFSVHSLARGLHYFVRCTVRPIFDVLIMRP